MQLLPVISWNPCGSCVSLTAGAICKLSGSAYPTILRDIPEPALILVKHIYKGAGAKRINF